jgi:hypothetical protein
MKAAKWFRPHKEKGQIPISHDRTINLYNAFRRLAEERLLGLQLTSLVLNFRQALNVDNPCAIESLAPATGLPLMVADPSGAIETSAPWQYCAIGLFSSTRDA